MSLNNESASLDRFRDT